jgi:U3 small nucleolar RNA-associated protein 7
MARDDDGGNDPPTTLSEAYAAGKKKDRSKRGGSKKKRGGDRDEFDPDGTLNVARGGIVERVPVPGGAVVEDRNGGVGTAAHKPSPPMAASAVPVEAIQRHLHGTETAATMMERRRAILKDDDARPIVKDPRTQRAIESRKRSRSKTVSSAITRHENKRWNAAVASASAQLLLADEPGMLEAEHDMEHTGRVTQEQLVRTLRHSNNDSSNAAAQHYQLKLPGTYGMEYDRSGRYSVLYGTQQGHLAIMDCQRRSLKCEFQVGERVHDAAFLHNFTLFATAQAHHTFIYDHTGAEVHRLSDHTDPLALQFLPYHWLLASVGKAGWLRYQDTSTGQVVSTHRTRLGPCRVLRQNPSNAVLHAGHSNGTVTLWSPAQSQYLAKVLCHKGASIQSLAVDLDGGTMLTGGSDRAVKVWDVRMMFAPMHAYATVGIPVSLDVSQRGVLGIAHGCHATFWKATALRQKDRESYMHHLQAGTALHTLRFRPFEDACGVGHGNGVTSLIVPGSGEPNLDTSEYHTNPAQDVKQRREQEVRALLDKLSPTMIGLDPDMVGGVEESDPHKRLERMQELAEEADAAASGKPKKKKSSKKRGKSKIQTQLRRRKNNVIDQQTLKLREEREREKALEGSSKDGEDVRTIKESAPDALSRFF